jgi:hypothetical protein
MRRAARKWPSGQRIKTDSCACFSGRRGGGWANTPGNVRTLRPVLRAQLVNVATRGGGNEVWAGYF